MNDVTVSPPRPRLGWLKASACVVLFIGAFLGTCYAVHALAPFPRVPALKQKHAFFADRKDQYEVLFIGSSRVNHQFIPLQFDREMKAAGHPLRSFNFGRDGMWPPESLYMLRELLRLQPAKLKWVFIDLMNINASLEGNEATQRAVYWHDWRHTSMAIRETAGKRMNPEEQRHEILAHARLFFQWLVSLGDGSSDLVFRLKAEKEKEQKWAKDEGYQPGPENGLNPEQTEEFNKAINGLRRTTKARPMSPILRPELLALTAEIRALGAEPIFIVAPTIYPQERYSDWPPAGITTFSFDDPDRYPQLYKPEERYDPYHLGPKGAMIFTSELSRRFLEHLGGKK